LCQLREQRFAPSPCASNPALAYQMSDIVLLVLSEASGSKAQGEVSRAALRKMYEASSGNPIAAKVFSPAGSPVEGQVTFHLDLSLDSDTLEAVKDVVLQQASAYENNDRAEVIPRIRVPHGVKGFGIFAFIESIDFLGISVGDGGPEFETIAAKWQYEVGCTMRATCVRLVAEFLAPSLLHGMHFSCSRQVLMCFSEYEMWEGSAYNWSDYGHDWLAAALPELDRRANILVFLSVREKRKKRRGKKSYKTFQVEGCSGRMLEEQEVAWEDVFDSLVMDLFSEAFHREVMRDVLQSHPAFKGLGVSVHGESQAVLLTGTW